MKIDRNTAVVLAVKKWLKDYAPILVDSLPYKKSPDLMALLNKLVVANVNAYFTLHPATEEEIKRKARQGWYEPDVIEKGDELPA